MLDTGSSVFALFVSPAPYKLNALAAVRATASQVSPHRNVGAINIFLHARAHAHTHARARLYIYTRAHTHGDLRGRGRGRELPRPRSAPSRPPRSARNARSALGGLPHAAKMAVLVRSLPPTGNVGAPRLRGASVGLADVPPPALCLDGPSPSLTCGHPRSALPRLLVAARPRPLAHAVAAFIPAARRIHRTFFARRRSPSAISGVCDQVSLAHSAAGPARMREAHRQWLTPAGLGRGRSRRQRPRGRRESAAHAPAQHPARSGPSRAGRSATNPAAAEYMNRPGGNVQPGLASSPAQHRAIECVPGSGTPARCQAKRASIGRFPCASRRSKTAEVGPIDATALKPEATTTNEEGPAAIL